MIHVFSGMQVACFGIIHEMNHDNQIDIIHLCLRAFSRK